jgi:acetyl-CoA carboxylase biotin carboxyl carrier protein
MTFEEIRQLLDLVRQHELTEFELEREGFKIRIKKDGTIQVATAPAAQAPVVAPAAQAPASPAPAPAAAASPPPPLEEGEELAVVKSPIVGTFYRSPEPGAKSFVEVGDMVRQGQVLCIIEAMKLMNEITSDYEGEVAKVYVENGQAVQYGERLFAVRVT